MWGLLVLLAWAMQLAAAGQPGLCCGSAVCAVPGTWKQMFACDANTWTSHMQKPPWEWYLTAKTTQGDVVPLQCEGGLKSFNPCGSQTDCPGGVCVLVKMSAKQYLDRRLSCCRHCSWDMRFPVGAPIQVTAGNITLEPQELAIIAKYLDCNTFKAEFDAIDTLDITKGYISLDEWTKNFLSKTPQRQMIKNGMLSSLATFQAADLNKDNMLAFEEFIVFRHFWTPILLSNTAPARASNTRNADGPLGGAYYDASTVSVWVTTANNLMLRLYISNSWSSAQTREPREGEETNYRKLLDIDGSQRISLEEHYFRTFADINGDGFLEKWEFDLSLYNADSWNGPKRTQNAWEYHDIDADGRVEFMERKRVSGDRNGDNALSHEEWVAADYPEDYGPFEFSAIPSGVVGWDDYKNYLVYHHCSGAARRPYSTREMSPYSWDASCMLNFIVREDSPFVYNDTKGNLRGLPLAVVKQVSSRLGWNHSVSLVTYEVYANKTNPVATTDSVVNDFQLNLLDVTGRSLRLAVLSQYTDVPREWICSRSIWPEDGFVVVVRSQNYEPPFTNMIIFIIISPHFVNFFCTLFFTVLIVGHVVWIIERWNNPTQFHPDYSSGVMDGLWWAIVTQTTVGYGDKAPRSNVGKVFGIFWILYGLIVFGVFSSAVTGFLDEARAANSISDVSTLNGFKVGTLKQTAKFGLASLYGFNDWVCQDVATCLKELELKGIDALLVPRTEIVRHFRDSGLAFTKCGNPFKIVGKAAKPEDIPGSPSMMRICAWGDRRYASHYLMLAINSAAAEMTYDGSMSILMTVESERIYPPMVEDETCGGGSEWDFTLISIAIVLLLFYSAIQGLSEGGWMRKYFNVSKSHDEEHKAEKGGELTAGASAEAEAQAQSGDQGLILKPKTVASIPRRGFEERPPPLDPEHVPNLVKAATELGIANAVQGYNTRRVDMEFEAQRILLERNLKFFFTCSGVVLCSLCTMVGILIVIWGDQVQMPNFKLRDSKFAQ